MDAKRYILFSVIVLAVIGGGVLLLIFMGCVVNVRNRKKYVMLNSYVLCSV